ncbi:MAG: hypothetical protein P0Y62_00090 [Candidatus Chryseobacterium colombiense]|nr:hypothetical protein [Chryseobacterium sp.]WEK69951.1 MAG: hypothetical protein P0Y62_00090 [Chryseobacterium sp.]
MKKFIFLFFGILLFDIIYVFVYDQFLIDIEPNYLKYPFILIKFLASSPAIFFNKLLPFYAPIPVYQSILALIGNVLLQTFLVHRIFFKKKKLNENESI